MPNMTAAYPNCNPKHNPESDPMSPASNANMAHFNAALHNSSLGLCSLKSSMPVLDVEQLQLRTTT